MGGQEEMAALGRKIASEPTTRNDPDTWGEGGPLMQQPRAPSDAAVKSLPSTQPAQDRLVNYSGLAEVKDNSAPHLGGNILQGDPYTHCPRVIEYVLERFAVESAMDLGSGCGYAAQFFFTKGIKTVAVDGVARNIKISKYPAVCHDLATGPVITSVDLVYCHEVVEHIEEQYLENLLKSLTCGNYILMTHALPGQGGHHHVNCQPPEYWVHHLQRHGFTLLVEDTLRVRRIAAQEEAIYMARSGLVLGRS
jgi:hypothetical protein